jgi:hypothetical protein
VARRSERSTAGAREADDCRGGRAAGEQTGTGRVREAHELSEPADHGSLKVDGGVIAGDDARVHRSCRQRRHDASERGRRVDPPEEGGMAVTHGVRHDVAQGRGDQVLQRYRLLWQGQLEQLLTQCVGERLPDRP